MRAVSLSFYVLARLAKLFEARLKRKVQGTRCCQLLGHAEHHRVQSRVEPRAASPSLSPRASHLPFVSDARPADPQPRGHRALQFANRLMCAVFAARTLCPFF